MLDTAVMAKVLANKRESLVFFVPLIAVNRPVGDQYKNEDPLFAEKCPQFRSFTCHVNFVALLDIREPHNESICTICIFKLLWGHPLPRKKHLQT